LYFQKKFRVIILAALLAGWGIIQGQDPQFSQFYANPLFLNPALTGSIDCGRVILNYRNQWPSISNAYVSFDVSYDQFISKINSGIGVYAMSDRQGDGALVRNSVAAYYSYKLKVSEPIMISFGVQGQYYQAHLDQGKLTYGDQIDPTTGEIYKSTDEPPLTNNNIGVVDFSAGAAMTYYDQWFIGVAVHHLTEPNMSFYGDPNNKLPMKFTVHGGVTINASEGMLGNDNGEDYIIEPQILYMQQEKFKQLDFGLYVTKRPLVLGAWFRHNFSNPDAVVALVGVKFNNIRFGYSYDITVSKVGGSSGGAHEISFAWDFCIYKQENRRRIRAIKSPSF
jgi:type IX secretion system PorP/SprF family membrane protein